MCGGGGGGDASCDVNNLEADCDEDGAKKRDELVCGTDPDDPASKPDNATDCDGDGANNEDELGCGTDPNDATSIPLDLTDDDNDGFCNEVDVDDDNDGLIEILSLEMLYNIRYDLDGTHYDTDADDSAGKEGSNVGCLNNTCQGYELVQELDFDENKNGMTDDSYNSDAGWEPIGKSTQILNTIEFECTILNTTPYITIYKFSGDSITLCVGNLVGLSTASSSESANESCGPASLSTVAGRHPVPDTNNLESTLSLSIVDVDNPSAWINTLEILCETQLGVAGTLSKSGTALSKPYTIQAEDFPAIPSYEGTPFTAIFEGNGFAIKNLRINRPTLAYAGLFGQVGAGGIVRNLELEGSLSIRALANLGSIAGSNLGTIENIELDITNDGTDICYTSLNPMFTVAKKVVGSGTEATGTTETNAPTTGACP